MSLAKISAFLQSGTQQFEERHYGEAARSYESALAGTAIEKKDFRVWAEVRLSLGQCYSQLDMHVEAEHLDRETLKRLETSNDFGSEHKLTLELRLRLIGDISRTDTHLNAQTARTAEKVVLRQKNLAALKKHNVDQKKYLRMLCDQGFDLTRLGKLVEAGKVHEEALAVAATVYSEQDLELLEARHNYAYTLFKLKSFNKAKSLFDRNYKILADIPESKTKALEELRKETVAFYGACNEATGDLARSAAIFERSERSKARLPEPPKTPIVTGEEKAKDPPKIVVGESVKQEVETRSRGRTDLPLRNTSSAQEHRSVKKVKSADEFLKVTPSHGTEKPRRASSISAKNSAHKARVEDKAHSREDHLPGDKKHPALGKEVENRKKKDESHELRGAPLGRRPRSTSENRAAGDNEQLRAPAERKRPLSEPNVAEMVKKNAPVGVAAGDKSTERAKAASRTDVQHRSEPKVRQSGQSAVLFQGSIGPAFYRCVV